RWGAWSPAARRWPRARVRRSTPARAFGEGPRSRADLNGVTVADPDDGVDRDLVASADTGHFFLVALANASSDSLGVRQAIGTAHDHLRAAVRRQPHGNGRHQHGAAG